MYAQPGSPVSPVDPTKVRLDDEQMDTLAQALVIAGVSLRSAADLANALGDPLTARECEQRAERFEELHRLGLGVTRVTVRF